MHRCTLVSLLVTAAPLSPLFAQSTPLEAFRGNIAAIHARDRAAYLSHYLHTPALARVGPDGLRQGYEDFANGRDAGWPGASGGPSARSCRSARRSMPTRTAP